MSGVRKIRVREPATLPGNNQTATTLFVPCFGARQVGFLITATNSQLLEGQAGSVGMDGTNGNSAVDSSTMVDLATGTASAGNAIGARLDQGGKWILLVPATGLAARYINSFPWNFCRVSVNTPLLGTSTANDITGLTIDAYVWDDLTFAFEGKGLPPT